MELDELTKAKANLELELLDAVADALRRFKAKTGLTPERIDVHLERFQHMQAARPQYVVSRVEATITV